MEFSGRPYSTSGRAKWDYMTGRIYLIEWRQIEVAFFVYLPRKNAQSSRFSCYWFAWQQLAVSGEYREFPSFRAASGVGQKSELGFSSAETVGICRLNICYVGI